MRQCRCYLLLFAFTLGIASSQSQTAAPGNPGTPPNFQSNVRAVVVDVVVTNGKDEPVTGLDRKDFQILEDGKPQTISDFEEHKGVPANAIKLPPMPPNVFTNFPTSNTPDSVNVLLLDALNTQVTDQSYVHSQMIKYLKNIQPGSRIAIFVLTSRLRMIQSFTTDSSLLLAALNDKKRGGGPQASSLLISSFDGNSDQAQNSELQLDTEAAPGGETGAALGIMAHQGFEDMKQLQTNMRIEITLQAFQHLGRYFEGIAGRKNVIWFSGSFPIAIFPSPNAPQPFKNVEQFAGEIEKTAALLTASQMAIYPIAAEGLMPETQFDASSVPISEGDPRAQQAQRLRSLRTSRANRDSNLLSMQELATDTGGKVFYNTNGLSDALAHVISNGSRYYTLTYAPADREMNGKYRRIHVTLVEGDYKLAYRRGYYAEEATAVAAPGNNPAGDPLLPLLGFAMPDYTQILYKVRVQQNDPQPSPDAPRAGSNLDMKGPVTRYSVDFAFAVDDLKLQTTPDGVRHGNIQVTLVAYDREGKPLNLVTQASEMSLQPKVYASMRQVGMQLHKEIDVPQGEVYLRTGIYDLRSDNAGTLGVSLRVVSAKAAATK